MLLGFQRQFVGYVRDHSKRHSIRAMRKRPFRVGDVCDCYGDVRQKSMYLIGRWLCVGVQEIRIRMVQEGIFKRRLQIVIEGETLSRDEAVSLAWADGFRNGTRETALDRMAWFWIREHRLDTRRRSYEFVGQLIHWNPEVRIDKPAKGRRDRQVRNGTAPNSVQRIRKRIPRLVSHSRI
jgi:hypothetical protein